jgi:Zn-dependent peptidase ImmA (M78 family)
MPMPVLLESNAPHICATDFDKEAILFLEQYYPEALLRPMAVPILYIARHKMGLRVVERRLTEDFSVLGQMCFTSGFEDIYDKDSDEYHAVKVRYGTMIIDPDTIAKRNEGCKNNTIAHECFHWHKHRDYHIAISVLDKGKAQIIKSLYTEENPESPTANWSDEDWMEWQARGIAPRILMPLDQFNQMAAYYIEEYHSNLAIRQQWFSLRGWVVKCLSEFFKVSKQSASIRLGEAGYF